MEKRLTSRSWALSFAHSLSFKEREVLVLLALGLNSKESSVKLNVLPKSIDNYKNRISKKLWVKGYGALCAFAIEHKDLLLEWSFFLFPYETEVTAKPGILPKSETLPIKEMEQVSGGLSLNLMPDWPRVGSVHLEADYLLDQCLLTAYQP
jgi:DNA-binding CsgD family transcriptional regulator